MDRVDRAVVGAGVIALAVARRLRKRGREVIVLEEAEGIGTITSFCNSEVIHTGIYYEADSLMARTCSPARRCCANTAPKHGVPRKNRGKLIVATTPAEAEKLQSIRAHAEANGVLDIRSCPASLAGSLR